MYLLDIYHQTIQVFRCNTIITLYFFFLYHFKSTSLQEGIGCFQIMLYFCKDVMCKAHGIDHNTLDILYMAWKFYSGKPLQPTNYIAFCSPLTNCPLGKDGTCAHLLNF